MNHRIYIALACVLAISPVRAASFDCLKAQSDVEKLICYSPTISVLDDAIGRVYQELMNKANGSEKTFLRDAQKNWLKTTRNVCANEACLKNAYFRRMEVLSRISSEMAKGTNNLVDTTIPQVEAAQSSMSKSTLVEIQDLLNRQHQQLKAMRKKARDVLFDGEPASKSNAAYCKRFWRALDAQDKFDIPKPDMVVVDTASKDALFEVMYAAGRNNYSRFLSQNGKLNPSTFIYEGEEQGLGPFVNGKANYLQELKQRFELDWRRSDFLEPNDYNLLESGTPIHLLYMQPYPVEGYARPLLLTLVQDSCDQCKGISMRDKIVSVDGLLHPEGIFSDRIFISQGAYAEALAVSERRKAMEPIGPFLLMGAGMFEGQFTLWTLKKRTQVCSEPSASVLDENFGANDPIPPCPDYTIMVLPLFDNPGYKGPNVSCTVEFNHN